MTRACPDILSCLPPGFAEQWRVERVVRNDVPWISAVVVRNGDGGGHGQRAVLKHAPTGSEDRSIIAAAHLLWFRLVHDRLWSVLSGHPAYSKVDIQSPSLGFLGHVRPFPPGSRALDQRFGTDPPTVRELVGIALRIADAIDFHRRVGIGHFNIKPSNVILLADGTVALVDMVTAPLAPAVAHPFYSAPEVRSATSETIGTLDHRADIYSLGMILLRGLGGAGGDPGGLLEVVAHRYGPEAARVLSDMVHPCRERRTADPVRAVLELEGALAGVGAIEPPSVPTSIPEAILRRDPVALRSILGRSRMVEPVEMEYLFRAFQVGEPFARPFLRAMDEGWIVVDHGEGRLETREEWQYEGAGRVRLLLRGRARLLYFDSPLSGEPALVQETAKAVGDVERPLPTPSFARLPHPIAYDAVRRDRRLAGYWIGHRITGRDVVDRVLNLYEGAASLGHGGAVFETVRKMAEEDGGLDLKDGREAMRIRQTLLLSVHHGDVDWLLYLADREESVVEEAVVMALTLIMWDGITGTDFYLQRARRLLSRLRMAPSGGGGAGSMECEAFQIAALIDRPDLVEEFMGDGDEKKWIQALFIAAERDSVRTLINIVERGIDVDPRGIDGRTPLMQAVQEDRREAALLLLRHGADVMARDARGWTAMAIAAYHGHAEMVRLLASHGADVNGTNGDGVTPLMLAVLAGHTGTVETLLELGADPLQKDGRGRDVFWLFDPERSPELEALFEEWLDAPSPPVPEHAVEMGGYEVDRVFHCTIG